VTDEQINTSWGQKGREQQVQAVRLVRMLVAQALAYFSANASQSLSLARAHLMELVDDKPSAAQGQNLRSAHAVLGRNADAFSRAVQTALADGIKRELVRVLPTASAGNPSPTEGAIAGLSLSLVDVKDVERILQLDRVAQRFTSRCEAALEPLTQRLGLLLGRETVCLSDNPFKPLVFLRAFMEAWDACGFDPQAADDLLLSLEPASWLDLKPLYTQLNTTLEQAGVAGQRELRIRRSVDGAGGHSGVSGSPSAPALLDATESASARLGGTDGGARSAWAALAPAGRSVAAHARQFLQRLGFGVTAAESAHHSDSATSQAGGAGQVVHAQADPALMGYLGNLQAGASSAATAPWAEGQDLGQHNVLRHMRDQDEIRSAPELDRGTVDALAEVFDFVFADQAIPVQMKMVIGRLQIPVLKAAMIDRDFFLSDQHPARRLVDTLAGASVAWAPEKGENDPLYVRIEQTVQRVLNEFEDDLALFADLLRDFTEFLFESEQQAQAQVEPVAQKEHKGEAWEQALSEADDWIHARIEAQAPQLPLTPFLLPFLSIQWREVMARALFDEPAAGQTQAQAYEQTQATMEQLIGSTLPKTTAEDRRELVAVLPTLVRQLNVGLDAIAWDGKPRAEFTRRLIGTHTMAIRLTQHAPLDTGSAALEAREGEAALQKLDERRAARNFGAEDEFDAQAQAMKRGIWFEVTLDQSTKTRSRLSWISPMRTRFLFTNRDGFDAFVRAEREVAAMLRLGTLRLLDAQPIVGRALEQIMGDQELRMAA
jgi:hypothetical protein